MDEEMATLRKNDTWYLVSLLDDRNPLDVIKCSNGRSIQMLVLKSTRQGWW